jgi:hypothetical protein
MTTQAYRIVVATDLCPHSQLFPDMTKTAVHIAACTLWSGLYLLLGLLANKFLLERLDALFPAVDQPAQNSAAAARSPTAQKPSSGVNPQSNAVVPIPERLVPINRRAVPEYELPLRSSEPQQTSNSDANGLVKDNEGGDGSTLPDDKVNNPSPRHPSPGPENNGSNECRSASLEYQVQQRRMDSGGRNVRFSPVGSPRSSGGVKRGPMARSSTSPPPQGLPAAAFRSLTFRDVGRVLADGVARYYILIVLFSLTSSVVLLQETLVATTYFVTWTECGKYSFNLYVEAPLALVQYFLASTLLLTLYQLVDSVMKHPRQYHVRRSAIAYGIVLTASATFLTITYLPSTVSEASSGIWAAVAAYIQVGMSVGFCATSCYVGWKVPGVIRGIVTRRAVLKVRVVTVLLATYFLLRGIYEIPVEYGVKIVFNYRYDRSPSALFVAMVLNFIPIAMALSVLRYFREN